MMPLDTPYQRPKYIHTHSETIRRVVLVSDIHAGKNWRRVSEEEWLRPLDEPFSTLSDEDLLIVSGDIFHHPNPKVAVVKEVEKMFQQLSFDGVPKILAAGNHDLQQTNRMNALSLLESSRSFLTKDFIYGHYGYGTPSDMFEIHIYPNMTIGVLNWPTIEMFASHPEFPSTESLRTQLEEASKCVIADIGDALAAAEIQKLTLLVGHAHTYTPSESGEYPEHLAGRDILLPDTKLRGMAEHIALGHIHTPSDLYVGSTQPTDLADTGPKRWLELKGDEMISHPYKSSINVVEVKLKNPGSDEIASAHLNYLPNPDRSRNVLRLVLDMREGGGLPTGVETQLLHKQLRDEAKWDDVEIVIIPPERKVRHESGMDESNMKPEEIVVEYASAFISTANATDPAKEKARVFIRDEINKTEE